MAFPGTFNISYYRGDTYEFRIYPKTSSGATFDLTPFADSGSDHVKFTIASNRGSGSISSTAYTATLTSGESSVTLTDGTTDSISPGQLLVKTTGDGDFGTVARVASVQNVLEFTTTEDHATSGDIVFSVASTYDAVATVSADKTYITCTITPDVGGLLLPNSTYVYDVEIKNSASPYDYVYTVLTGNISVTDQVTGAI
jgi:hypothetical protein